MTAVAFEKSRAKLLMAMMEGLEGLCSCSSHSCMIGIRSSSGSNWVTEGLAVWMGPSRLPFSMVGRWATKSMAIGLQALDDVK
jgi:hypothetical protein